MEPVSPGPAGYVQSLRALADSLLASAQHRLELFAVELREQKYRLIQTLVWISAALLTGMLAVTFASLTLVYLFWESARLAVLGGLALFYSFVLIAILVALRRHFARQPHPFAATLQEIEEDRACIRPES